jgi:hypothetical protein
VAPIPVPVDPEDLTPAQRLGRASGEARRAKRDAVARVVQASRRAQDLPPTVSDLEVLERVAALIEGDGSDGPAT